MFFAFISNDMVITTEIMCYNSNFLIGNTYCYEKPESLGTSNHLLFVAEKQELACQSD